jgi:hypothetical protein
MQRLASILRDSDLFAIPVTLAHQGRTTFNTVLGGCVTILLGLSLLAGFSVQIWILCYEPEYLVLPTTYSFDN